jgi:hypothetical protein
MATTHYGMASTSRSRRPESGWSSFWCLLDDLYNPAGRGVDKNNLVIDHSVAILASAIFGRHLIIFYAVSWQDDANRYIVLIFKGWSVLGDHVFTETRALLNPDEPVDAARNSADRTTDDRTDGPCFLVAFFRPVRRAAHNALGINRRWCQKTGHQYAC